MHPDEPDIDTPLVRALLAGQFPQWASLSVAPVPSSGTDHMLYRLGPDMLVRLPRVYWAVGQVDKELTWLPRLAAHLPLAIPRPLARGEPAHGYPWAWGIYQWIDGEGATIDHAHDSHQLARDLARFIVALHQIDPANGPPAGDHNFFRGVPLAMRDAPTRAAIDALRGVIDTAAVTAAWDAALSAPPWNQPPVWIHGDLQAGNLLLVNNSLRAVIDFGGLAVGDPACDLMPAWNLFSAAARDTFRAAAAVDDATWSRARGWAVSVSLIALPYYKETNPTLAATARHAIEQVLADRSGA
jgi:aminoglycoside phosphotransferase (APT) family kinase protein